MTAPYPRTEAEATAEAVYRYLLDQAERARLVIGPSPASDAPEEERRAHTARVWAYVGAWTAACLLQGAREHMPYWVADRYATAVWAAWQNTTQMHRSLAEWRAAEGLPPTMATGTDQTNT